jgi:hypothetical protein
MKAGAQKNGQGGAVLLGTPGSSFTIVSPWMPDQRSSGQASWGKRPGHAETDQVVPAAGFGPFADGGARGPRDIEPGTAAHHPRCAGHLRPATVILTRIR